ncbi:hypothetical protein MKX01_001198, partial [Papaver californicum]
MLFCLFISIHLSLICFRKIKQPVLLQHGLLVGGMSWFLNSVDQSLGFILAVSGFDVWVANTRGTRYSRDHATLDASHPAYWNWSLSGIVQFDLPATFDFVLKQTEQKVHYVGHSLGTLVALASFSQGISSQVVDKLRLAALLSPVAYLSHMSTAFGVVAAKAFVGEIVTTFVAEFNINEVGSGFTGDLYPSWCMKHAFSLELLKCLTFRVFVEANCENQRRGLSR